jgi:transglutaminase-like putative cysteine protease
MSLFDGETWMPLQRARRGSLASASTAGIGYTVTLEPHGRQWLFALEHPSSLPRQAGDRPGEGIGEDLAAVTYEQQLIARAPLLQAVRYAQRSVLGDRFPAVGNFEARDNLLLPRDRNPRTIAFARELRGQVASDRAYIAAVLARFHDEQFVYTLNPSLLGEDPVDGFLFDSKRGFCEHYAGAFVVLLRAAGIPARVVTGYQGGEINPDGGYMIVRQSDAHAWAEALLDGQWQRFDPTAAVAPSRVERGLGAALTQGEPVPYLARLDMTWLKRLRLHWDAVNYQWQRSVVGFNVERQRDLLRDVGLDEARPWETVALAGAVLMAWGVLSLGWARVRTQREDPVVALWSRACRRLARAGLRREPDEGPLAYAQRAARRWPRWAAQLTRIGETYAVLRYGPETRQRAEQIDLLRSSVAALPATRALRSPR